MRVMSASFSGSSCVDHPLLECVRWDDFLSLSRGKIFFGGNTENPRVHDIEINTYLLKERGTQTMSSIYFEEACNFALNSPVKLARSYIPGAWVVPYKEVWGLSIPSAIVR